MKKKNKIKQEKSNSNKEKSSLFLICYVSEKFDVLKSVLESLCSNSVKEENVVVFVDDVKRKEITLIGDALPNVLFSENQLINNRSYNKTSDFVVYLDIDKISVKENINQWLIKNTNKKNKENVIIGEERQKKIDNVFYSLLLGYDKNELNSPIIIVPTSISNNFISTTNIGCITNIKLFLLNYFRQNSIKVNHSELKEKNSVSSSLFKLWLNILLLKFNDNFITPIKLLFKTNNQNYLIDKPQAFFKLMFFITVVALFFVMPYLSCDYGISGDEWKHHEQAKFVADYYSKGDEKCLDQPKTLLHYYGQSVDLLSVIVINAFDFKNTYIVRHVINSLTGVLSILFVGLMAVRIAGFGAGLIALMMMIVSLRFFGHSMNNSMDVPFAMGYIMTIYYTICLFREYPKIRLKYLFLMIIGIGFTISIRVGGILLIPYIIMFCGLFILKEKGVKNILNFKVYKSYYNIIRSLIFVFVAGFFVGIIPWPYALESPLSNPFTALKELSNISVSVAQIFEGVHVKSDALPSYYLFKFLFIGTPILILLGLVSYLVISLIRIKEFTLEQFFVFFTFCFPVLYIMYKGSNVYGGYRHIMFVYPSMLVLSVLGWIFLFKLFKYKWYKYTMLIMFLFLFSLPMSWSVKNHPFQYVYYNELIGGVKGAIGEYELDYYINSLKQGSDWLMNSDEFNTTRKKKKTIIIATNHGGEVRHYFRNIENVKVFYTRYDDRSKKEWDYGIFYNGYINESLLKNKLYPPEGTIHNILVDSVPLCAVVKRDAMKLDYLGFQALSKNNHDSSIVCFKKYLELYPENEQIWQGLADISFRRKDYANTIKYAKEAVKRHSNLFSSMDMLGKSYMYTGDFDNSILSFNKMINLNVRYNHVVFYFLGVSYFYKEQYNMAIKMASNSLKLNPRFPEANRLMGDIYTRMGDKRNANLYYSRVKKN